MIMYILGVLVFSILALYFCEIIGFFCAIIFFFVKILTGIFKRARWYFRAFLAAIRNDTENKYYKEYKEYEHYLKVYNTLGRRPKPHRSL